MAESSGDDRRPAVVKIDLARALRIEMIAGSIAAGYAANPRTSGEPRERIARWSVEMATAIVAIGEQQNGLEP
jgi:LDH2 family malate/lactate/ureidoglycolate dehydrogenase